MGSGVKLHRSNLEPSMSALGQKRTFTYLRPMSALPPKADIDQDGCNFRFVPKVDITTDETIDKSLMFLPNALPNGIQSADPMIDARGAAYPVSFGHRQ
jgi:hypothetical protein